jgi:hypothetical protein
MTVSRLKRLYQNNNPKGCYFDRQTMRFFGDSISNYKIKDGGKIKMFNGKIFELVDVWELHRKKPVNGGLHGKAGCFRKDNGQLIYNFTIAS